MSERLHERLVERFGEMFCKRLGDTYKLHASFKYVQEGLNVSQLPSPDEGLVFKLSI